MKKASVSLIPIIHFAFKGLSSAPFFFKLFVILVLGISIQNEIQAQSTRADGNWTTNSSWVGQVPSTDGSWGDPINIGHGITLGSNLTMGNGRTLNVNSGGVLGVTGNVTNNSIINIYDGGSLNIVGNMVNNQPLNVYGGGTLRISGDLTINGPLRIYPGAKVIIEGNVNIIDAEYLFIGNNTGGTLYADMIIGKSLAFQGGIANIESNGRLAVWGNVTSDTKGGVAFRVHSGGQAYVHGDIAFTGGGDAITNNNTTNPYGLYVNGVVSNRGGGTTTTSNRASQQVMYDTNRPFYDWVFSNSITILPVNLLYFKAAAQQQSVEVSWASSRAWNFSHYELERSADGGSFEYIATIEADEFSNETQYYSYADGQPLSGTSYYRLKAVDVDGSFEYKEVAVVKFGAEVFSVYPNPSTGGYITISWTHAGSGARCSLKDSSGRTVRSASLSSASHTLATDGLSAGVYFLTVQGPSGIQQAQVLVK